MSALQSWRMDMGVTARAVVVVTADAGLRQRLGEGLTQLRWTVREASGGAEAMAMAETDRPEAMIVDSWLPDLEVGEFAGHVGRMFPGMDLLRLDGTAMEGGTRSPRRNELLHAIRVAEEFEGDAAGETELSRTAALPPSKSPQRSSTPLLRAGMPLLRAGVPALRAPVQFRSDAPVQLRAMRPGGVALPEMVGQSAEMLELARMIRLVAPRTATVLIEGETGTGKEVVAKALHRLSARAGKPFVVLNCAAIPESLLEAELFGHTRGAFTGAVTSRTGRIEAAHGGTLFLDEIGEMPLALQAKMLRFLECGELQKVGENDTVRVDVRVIAATHQELERRAAEKTFRLDLYHRLAVFPLSVPALRERMEDLPLLVDFFLEQMGREAPRKGITEAAMGRLAQYDWPGNVRELMHVLERASILAEDRALIGEDEIRVKARLRG